MKAMELKRKKYTLLDMIAFVFRASPFACAFKIIVSLGVGIMPAFSVIWTADFIRAAVASASGTGPLTAIWWPLAGMVFAFSLDVVTSSIVRVLAIRINFNLFKTFREAITTHRSRLAFYHIEDNATYDLIQRVADEPNSRVIEAFDCLMWLTTMVLNIASVIAVLIFSMPLTAVLILLFAVPVLWFALKTGKINYGGFKKARTIARRYNYLGGILTQRDAVTERAMYEFSDGISERYNQTFDESAEVLKKTYRRIAVRSTTSNALSAALSIIIAVVMIFPVLKNPETFPVYVSLVGMIFMLVQYTSYRIPRRITHLSEFSEFLKDLTTFAAMETVPGSDALPVPPTEPIQSIEFRDVWFRYPQTDIDILKGVSFTMNQNKHYAMVGINGAGKTTIVKLLTGLYTDYKGEIFIDGRELRTIPLEEKKGLIVTIYQDFARYPVTLYENIAMGAGVDLTCEQPDIGAAKELFHIDEIAEELAHGQDTVLGKSMPQGQDLSGGQWQRVALARAVARSAPMLILDEPTAALDPRSECEVYQNFGKIGQSQMTLFISHRLGSTMLADEIIVLSQGLVSEQGSHDTLMKEGGLYAQMYAAQKEWYEG